MSTFQEEWKEFFSKWNIALEKDSGLRLKASSVAMVGWPEEQGFGSSDFNHSVFGAYKEADTPAAIVKMVDEDFTANFGTVC